MYGAGGGVPVTYCTQHEKKKKNELHVAEHIRLSYYSVLTYHQAVTTLPVHRAHEETIQSVRKREKEGDWRQKITADRHSLTVSRTNHVNV